MLSRAIGVRTQADLSVLCPGFLGLTREQHDAAAVTPSAGHSRQSSPHVAYCDVVDGARSRQRTPIG